MEDPALRQKHLKELLSEMDDSLSDVLTPEERKALEREAGLTREEIIEGYTVKDGGFARVRFSKKGDVVHEKLSNFTATIEEEVIFDDGAERTLYFTITGKLKGRPLPKVRIPAEKFASLSWVTQSWGAKALVYPGHNTKDHLRFAVQVYSKNLRRREVFTHVGWRKIRETWLFLHAGGAIGPQGPAEGVEVELEERLRNYVLPDPPEEEALKEAVRSSLSLLELAPGRIMAPLLGAVYSAPLGEVLSLDFSLFLTGKTGGFKTETSALLLSHFGTWNSRNLPGNWESTPNALEKAAFLAKDVLFVVDDFVVKGGKNNLQQLHAKADRVLRGAANRAGRARMKSDRTLAPEYFPRGLVLASGEDVPFGQSLRARTLTLEVKAPGGGSPGDVDVAKLTEAQEMAQRGVFSRAMSGYIRWLSSRMEELKTSLSGRRRELREEFRSFSHFRSPDIGAALLLGWEQFLSFAEDSGILSPQEKISLWQKARNGIFEAVKLQEELQKAEDPTERFFTLLSEALLAGRAHLISPDGGRPENAQALGWQNDGERWRPQGERIGAINPDELFLFPEAAYNVAQRMALDQGHSLDVSSRTMGRRLKEKGLLLAFDSRGYTAKRLIAGKKARVYVLPGDILWRDTPPCNIRDFRDQGENPDVERIPGLSEEGKYQKISGTGSGTETYLRPVPDVTPDAKLTSGTKEGDGSLEDQGPSRKSRISRKIIHNPSSQDERSGESEIIIG